MLSVSLLITTASTSPWSDMSSITHDANWEEVGDVGFQAQEGRLQHNAVQLAQRASVKAGGPVRPPPASWQRTGQLRGEAAAHLEGGGPHRRAQAVQPDSRCSARRGGRTKTELAAWPVHEAVMLMLCVPSTSPSRAAAGE